MSGHTFEQLEERFVANVMYVGKLHTSSAFKSLYAIPHPSRFGERIYSDCTYTLNRAYMDCFELSAEDLLWYEKK